MLGVGCVAIYAVRAEEEEVGGGKCGGTGRLDHIPSTLFLCSGEDALRTQGT